MAKSGQNLNEKLFDEIEVYGKYSVAGNNKGIQGCFDKIRELIQDGAKVSLNKSINADGSYTNQDTLSYAYEKGGVELCRFMMGNLKDKLHDVWKVESIITLLDGSHTDSPLYHALETKNTELVSLYSEFFNESLPLIGYIGKKPAFSEITQTYSEDDWAEMESAILGAIGDGN